MDADGLTRFLPPADGGRESAVLVLFGEGADGPDVLLIERAARLALARRSAGVPGRRDRARTTTAPVAAALREASEETGLDPAGVEVFAELPSLWLPPQRLRGDAGAGLVARPSAVHAVDPAEVAAVHRVPVAELVDPANRVRVATPAATSARPSQVRGMLVWGFTGGLLDRILSIGGFALPWDEDRMVPLPDDLLTGDGTGR